MPNNNISVALMIDGYKADHRRQYPIGTEKVYSNFTPRQSRVFGVDSVVFFGLQYFIKEYLIKRWNDDFFSKPKSEVVSAYKRRLDNYLGAGAVPCEHMEALHGLGYLPIRIKALAEGTIVPIGVPVLTIINTKPEFFWITNYLETLISNVLWKPITSATTAFQYRKKFETYSKYTGYSKEAIKWQGHDFSLRGMSGNEDGILSGAGHLLSFTGTDSIPSIDFLENYYHADSDKELIGGSVPATEHSVMCMGGSGGEIDTFRRLISEVYPSGIVSIVSDTWDFWEVMGTYLPILKEEILYRDGKVVIRPDSGDPVKIICGDPDSDIEIVRVGAYETLWNIFGGTINNDGYKELDAHIGMIYGDSITLDRQDEILKQLASKGFSASNLVLGIGSYTYEYVTRDTFGFAMKATWGVVNGEPVEIYKDPKTDAGFKKSARGLLRVEKNNGELVLRDRVDEVLERGGELQTVYEDGVHLYEHTLSEIRNRLETYL
jgi:nicotinamide phosphoribosyltransferase